MQKRMVQMILGMTVPTLAQAAENGSAAFGLGRTLGLIVFGYFVLRWINGRNK